MEPLTLLWGLAATAITIVSKGTLTKVGENIADGPINQLFKFLKEKLPDSVTVKLIETGMKIDYDKAYMELDPILSKDSTAIDLFEAVKDHINDNLELMDKVKTELDSPQAQIQLEWR
jgi:hypothetical protein